MKQQLTNIPPQFDLKFLLVGSSGVGKTHLCATYTQGPVHFYMTDPGGQKTLYKLNQNRPESSPISIDIFSHKDSFSNIWKQLQIDAKAGFFEEMFEKKGLVVLPDSLTTISNIITEEVAKKNGRSLTDSSRPLRIQDWGVISGWLKELISTINDLPCAVVSTAHLHVDVNEEGAVIGRWPFIQGRFKYVMSSMYDEVYLLERRNADHIIYFKEKSLFEAKTRTFTETSVKNVTMDDIADAYLLGKKLKEVTPDKK